MITSHNPDTAFHGPGHYSHAVEVQAGANLLFVSGQLPVKPDGSLPDDTEGQCKAAWNNVRSVLEASDYAIRDLVKITMFLTNPDDRKTANEVRKSILGENSPASTGIVITSLANPHWRIEIEAIAAKS